MTDAHNLTLTRDNLGGLQVHKPQDVEAFFNMLIYGDPGVGKTTLAASASIVEEMSPLLFIDVEGGTMSIRNRYPNVDVIRIRKFTEFIELINALRTDLPYKTIVPDSLTEIQKMGMYEIMYRAVEKDEDRDPDLPGIGEWGKNIEQTRKIVRALRDLPCNTIFTALAMTEMNNRGDTKTAKPSLSGKLSSEVAGFMDIVCYMYKKNIADEAEEVPDIQRMMLSMGTDDIIAKDRTDNLPPVMIAPTMQEIYQIIHAQEKENSNV